MILHVLDVIEVCWVALLVKILGKGPEGRVDSGADPFDAVTVVVAGDEASVVVNSKELVALLCVVPDAGIDDDLRTVIHLDCIGYADLLCRIGLEVTLFYGSLLYQIHPRRSVVFRDCIEALASITRKVERPIANAEVPLASIRSDSRHCPNE